MFLALLRSDMITRETDYAIRMILCLAHESEGERVPTSDIAERMDIPYRFLRALGRKLATAGIVTSKRGNAGGFRLNRSPSKISLLDVITVIDPKSVTLNSCLLGHGTCPRDDTCSVHRELAKLQEKLRDALASVRFDVLSADMMDD